jgi:hypothetical protein
MANTTGDFEKPRETATVWVSCPNLGGIVALTLALTVVGQRAAEAQAWCGPHLATYVRAETTIGDAVMCVRFVDRASFAFYMEGLEDGRTFRRLGYAYRPSTGSVRDRELNFTVRWANITGNGEDIEGSATSIEAFGTIGYYDWNENSPPEHLVWIDMRPAVWRRWKPGHGTPMVPSLRPVSQCGPGLRRYTVTDINGASAPGVRCTLAANDHAIAAWVGAGTWGKSGYLHIGTAFFGVLGTRYAASDICRPGLTCSRTTLGEIEIDAESRPYVVVRGAWREHWLPVR